MKKNLTRWMSLALAGVMTLSLAGCGQKQEENTDVTGTVFVPKYVSLPETGSNSYRNVREVVGDVLYYEESNYDDTNGTSTISYYKVDLLSEGMEPQLLVTLENYNVSPMQITFDNQGQLIRASRVYEVQEMAGPNGETYTVNNYDKAPKLVLEKYSADGTSLFQVDISGYFSDPEYTYVQYLITDTQDNIYMSDGDTTMWVFDTEGQFLFQTAFYNWVNGIGRSKDGEIYVTQGGIENTLSKVDLAAKGMGSSLTGLPESFYTAAVPGRSEDFLLKTDTSLFEYDVETQTSEKLFDFLDCDVNGSQVQLVSALSNGNIFVYHRDWSQNADDLIVLEEKDAAEVPQKEIVTLGVTYLYSDMQSNIVNFNKSNDKYRIMVEDYSQDESTEDSFLGGSTRLNNELVTGNAPDLISLDAVDFVPMAQKGVFEDLKTYLANSTVLNQDDILSSIMEAYTVSDVLCGIPTSFSLNVILGASALVGDKMGWTVDEMLQVVENTPEDVEIFEVATKGSQLQQLVNYGISDFIDWETGTCSFDGDTFKRLLELCNQFPTEWSYDEDAPSMPEMVRDGKLLLVDQYLSSPDEYQLMNDIFQQPITCVGYPNGQGSAGVVIGRDALGINSSSKCKDGAWAFIEFMVSSENSGDVENLYEFSVLESQLEKQFEQSMVPYYETDWETGEVVVDEEGNPVEQSHGGYGWGNSDMIFEVYACTQEEVDAVREIIQHSTILASSNSQVMQIILEEVAPYFAGQKSVEEVTEIIQRRVQVYVDEIR